ncbi:MAG: hypothetical protein HWN79_09780 [Candidatus Lokiarchaeota archaeon]|nr:hypothetical protein [Candidatus Lokiarchaeota archaeon]
MKNKLKLLCVIGLFYFCIFTSCVNLNAKAQEDEYSVGFNEGTELIWEVAELDLMKFKETFGFEPNFEIGDQNRMIIREIDSAAGVWTIEIEFWDYKTDWGLSGRTVTLFMGKDPSQYDDYLFSLYPVEQYLDEAISHLPTDYYRLGLSVYKQGKSSTGLDYLWEKEYDSRGILITETVYDEFDQIIIRLEGTFRFIPFGMYFIGFTILAIIAIIGVSIRKNKLRIKSV